MIVYFYEAILYERTTHFHVLFPIQDLIGVSIQYFYTDLGLVCTIFL